MRVNQHIFFTALCICYLVNGEREYMSLHNFEAEEIYKWCDHLTTRSGYPIVKLLKNQHTDVPSIQGPWTPWTHKSPAVNTATFPNVSSLILV